MKLTKKIPETEIGIATPNGHTFATPTQILQWKENSEKYNNLMKANAQVVQDNINITKEHQIIERLKKELRQTEEYLNSYPNYEGSGTVEVKKRIIPILEEILLGEKKC